MLHPEAQARLTHTIVDTDSLAVCLTVLTSNTQPGANGSFCCLRYADHKIFAQGQEDCSSEPTRLGSKQWVTCAA